MTVANQLPHVKTEKPQERGLFQICWAHRYQKDECPVPASPRLAAPSNRTAADHHKSQGARTKKSFILKRLSRLCPGCPELGREVWLGKRNMNGNQLEDRIYPSLEDRIYLSLEAGNCTLFEKPMTNSSFTGTKYWQQGRAILHTVTLLTVTISSRVRVHVLFRISNHN